MFKRMGWTLEPRTHVQLNVPEGIVQSVIADETARQKKGRQ
jgi:hypothetical protein